MACYIEYATRNERAINESTECACVYCLYILKPSEIVDYIHLSEDVDELGTALCPNCGIDSIIPNSLVKYNKDSLEQWNKMGFKTVTKLEILD